jgi:hypothetical protein
MFIIVGIVIVLILGLGVAAWRTINKEKPPEPVIQQEVNVELKPLLNYIDRCLEQVGYESIDNIGLHGGYSNPLDAGLIAIPGRPADGNSFEPFPGMTVPYWSYMSSPNDCTDCTMSSERSSIHEQIAKAVEERLPNCINNFAGLENRYKITVEGEPSTNVELNDQYIAITFHQKLIVETTTTSVTTLENFSAKVNVPLGRLYRMADSIRKTAQASKYFESLTMNTITLEAVGDPEPIPPPFGDSELSWDPGPFWMLQKTKEIVASALETNIGIVQLWGSEGMNFVYTDNETYNRQFANYYFSAPGTDPDIAASFLYFSDWEPYMRVYPGNQFIKPETVSSGLFLIPPLKRKVFTYDVSYPILVQLRAPTDRGDYLFQFGLEVNVRDNKPLPYDPFEQQEPDITYCDPLYWNAATLAASVVSGEGQPLRADVYYDCAQESCFVRKTAGNGLLTTQLPACINGVLRAEKLGYLGVPVPFDSLDGHEGEAQLVLHRLKPVNIMLKERQVVKIGNNLFDVGINEFEVDPAYHNMITIFKSRSVPEHVQVVTGPGGVVELFPDIYDITVVGTGVMYEPIVIPEVYYPEKCAGIDTPFGCVGETIPAHTIPEVVIGGTICNPDTYECSDVSEMYIGGLEWNENMNVSITQDMIDSGNLIIPALIIPPANWFFSVHEDLAVYDQIPELSKRVYIQW